MTKFVLRLILILFSVTILAQCGNEDSASQDVGVDFTPEEPFIRITDADIDNDGTVDYSKNWLRFSMCINNDSDQTFTVFGFTVEVFDTTGESLGTADFDSTEIGDTKFAEIAPGESHNMDSGSCSASGASPQVFIVEGISEPANENFRLRVKVKPLGFFGTEADPEDRFSNDYTFYTQ